MLTSRLLSRHLRPIQPFTPIFSVLEKEFGYAGSRNGVNRQFGRGGGRGWVGGGAQNRETVENHDPQTETADIGAPVP